MTLTTFFLPPSLLSLFLSLAGSGQHTFLHQALISSCGTCSAPCYLLLLHFSVDLFNALGELPWIWAFPQWFSITFLLPLLVLTIVYPYLILVKFYHLFAFLNSLLQFSIDAVNPLFFSGICAGSQGLGFIHTHLKHGFLDCNCVSLALLSSTLLLISAPHCSMSLFFFGYR